MMKLRRSMTALAGAAVLTLGGAPGALAQDEPDGGLYGENDPTYDGVWRQSATVLALTGTGGTVPDPAVEWLAGQQCEDGAFPAYRADATVPCTDAEPADTNATALAIQALAAVGEDAAVTAGARWLASVRNDDGGWPYTPGEATDANSTAVVVGALAAAGAADADLTGAQQALRGLQLGCDAGEDATGGYAWQPEPESGDLFLNETATVDAVLASYGSGLAVEPATDPATPAALDCDDAAEPDDGRLAEAGAARLVALLDASGQAVVSSLGDGGPDFGATSRAVLALAAGGFGGSADGPLTWLAENHTDWAGYDTNPGALAQLILAAQAGGADPTDFGGTDLPAALAALGPLDAGTDEPAPDGAGDDAADDTADATGDDATGDDATGDDESDDSSNAWLLWLLGVGLLAGIGIGLLAAMRRRRSGTGDDAPAGDDAPGGGDSGGDSGGDA